MTNFWLTGQMINGIKVERIDAHPNNFTNESARQGYYAYCNHWMAGRLEAAVARFTSETGKASAHFSVSDDRIIQHAPLNAVCWTIGDWIANCKTINTELEGGWSVTGDAQEQRFKPTPKVHENAAALMKAVAACLSQNIDDYVDGDFYRVHSMDAIDPYKPGLAVIEHREVSSTMCPGSTDTQWIIDRANQLKNGMVVDVVPVLRVVEEFDPVQEWVCVQPTPIIDLESGAVVGNLQPGPTTFTIKRKVMNRTGDVFLQTRWSVENKKGNAVAINSFKRLDAPTPPPVPVEPPKIEPAKPPVETKPVEVPVSNEADKKRIAELEAMVQSLTSQVEAANKKADDFEDRADLAEMNLADTTELYNIKMSQCESQAKEIEVLTKQVKDLNDGLVVTKEEMEIINLWRQGQLFAKSKGFDLEKWKVGASRWGILYAIAAAFLDFIIRIVLGKFAPEALVTYQASMGQALELIKTYIVPLMGAYQVSKQIKEGVQGVPTVK